MSHQTFPVYSTTPQIGFPTLHEIIYLQKKGYPYSSSEGSLTCLHVSIKKNLKSLSCRERSHSENALKSQPSNKYTTSQPIM